MNRELKHRRTYELQYRGDHADSKALLMAAVEAGVYLDSSVDFGGVQLYNARLRGAKMFAADFSRANLEYADLRGSSLSKTCFSHANLTHANLGGAYMAESSFKQATACDAKMGDADLRYSYMQGADLRRADMSRAILKGADLRKADLRWADLGGADLSGTHFEGAKVGGNRWESANVGSADDYAVLVGPRPVVQIGPIGAEDGQMIVFWCGDAGIRISTDCHRQFIRQVPEDEFLSLLSKDREKSKQRQTYLDVLAFAKRILKDQAG